MSDLIRNLQEESQQEQIPVLVSQVAAEKRAAAARVDDAATESRLSSSAKNDTEDGDDDDFDDEDDESGHGGGESVTETGEIKTKETKEVKKPKKKKTKSEQPVREYFSETGEMHILMRRATLYWNCLSASIDIADPASHQERLKGALVAVQAYNMQGLRDRASSIFVGEFMRKNMADAASAADKVNTFLLV